MARARARAVADPARAVALAAVLVTLVVGAGYAATLGSALRFWDEQTYVAIADNLASGNGYSQFGNGPTAYRPPGYPLLLGLLRVAGVGPLGFRLVNVLFLAGSVYLVYALARRVGGPRAAVIATVAAAAYPLFYFQTGAIYPQALAMLLLLAGLRLALACRDAGPTRRRLWLGAALGLCFGALVLTVPTFAVLFLVVLVWLLVVARRAAVPLVAVALLTAVLLPGAWCVRNAVQLHAFIPLSTNNGVNLLLGNNEHAGPTTNTQVDIGRYVDVVEARHLDEIAADRYFQQSAIEWITAHPRQAAWLYLGKALNYFNFRNQLATPGESSAVRDIVSALTFYPVLALVVVRLLLARRRRLSSFEVLLVSLIVGNALVLAVYFTRLRYRIPLDSLAIVVAAGAVALLWRGRERPVAAEGAPAAAEAPVEAAASSDGATRRAP
jgi:4-amino-4-deoxy-L-arabinose transferase-like glycosyltransferase